MGRASASQHAFNAGELSPLMLGRQDVDKYKSGLFLCSNAIPLTQGGWTRRPGTVYMHQCKYHDKEARLFPFQYSVEQTYVLEFGEGYIRFYTSHGILTHAAQSITSVSKAAVGVLNKAGHGYSENDRILILPAVVGMRQLAGREVKALSVAPGSFNLYDSGSAGINTTNYDTFTSGTMAKIYEVATSFSEAELADIRITQSADTLFILHPEHPPQKLVRNSALSWTLSTIVFKDGPYDSANITATTLTPSAAVGGAITITASSTEGINEGLGFQSTDVGRLIRMQQGSVWGWVIITGINSTTSISATVQLTLTDTSAKTVWRMGVWSETTGYPTCATFYEDRLMLAGAALFPQRLDGSKSGNYTNFSPSNTADGAVAADNAIAYTLNADDVNAIRWMVPNDKGLLVGTSRGEWVIKASSLNEAVTPTNITGKPSTRHGSANLAPVVASKAVLFIQRGARKLRELAYVFEVDGFKAPDMSVLAEHITRGGITGLAYQEQPQAILWSTRAGGALLGMTYERDQDVIAWHKHTLGGHGDASHLTIPAVESIASVPAPDTTHDELYMISQRYINGGIRRHVEYMSELWEQDNEQEDAFFVDCGITIVNATATTLVSGLWAWEGETLNAYVDGGKHIDVTVANGKVTLARAGTVVTLGYFYNSDAQTMPIEGGSRDGSSQGKVKRIHRVGFWLIDTLGLKFGPSEDSLDELLERKWGAAYGSATPLFTGIARERFEGPYDKLGQIYWRADGPFPATVLSVLPQFETSDDS